MVRTVCIIQFYLRRKSVTYGIINISCLKIKVSSGCFLFKLWPSLAFVILHLFLWKKKKKHCLIETTVRSTCSVSGLWKPGCRRVVFRDILSTSYLHLCISIYKWSMTAGLWCCFCMFIGLCFILLQKCDPSVLLSLRFYIYMYACMYVSVCVYLSSFSCLAVISVY